MNDDHIPLYLELREVEDSMKALEKRRAEILELLTPQGNVEFDNGDVHVVAHVVRRETPVVNLVKLNELHPWLYERITKRVLDTQKFTKSLDAKEWTPDLLEQIVTINTSRPYIKFADYIAAGEEEEQ